MVVTYHENTIHIFQGCFLREEFWINHQAKIHRPPISSSFYVLRNQSIEGINHFVTFFPFESVFWQIFNFKSIPSSIPKLRIFEMCDSATRSTKCFDTTRPKWLRYNIMIHFNFTLYTKGKFTFGVKVTHLLLRLSCQCMVNELGNVYWIIELFEVTVSSDTNLGGSPI